MTFEFAAYMIAIYVFLGAFLLIYYTIYLVNIYREKHAPAMKSTEKARIQATAFQESSYHKNALIGLAGMTKSPESIKKAIAKGGDINKAANDGTTPLIEAARHNQNVPVIFALIQAGANVNALDDHQKSALAWAAGRNPNPLVLTALIEAGAIVDQLDHKEKTPLMYAAQYNPNPAIISTLLKAGADKNKRSYSGKTAYDYGHENPELYKTAVFNQLKTVEN